MGLLSVLGTIGRTLLSGGAAVARSTAARAAATGAVGGAAFVGAEQLLAQPAGAGGAAGPFTGIAPAGQAIGPSTNLGQLQAAGAVQTTPLSGGRFLATAMNGDVQVFNRMGMPVRPSLIVPAGQALPGGATVVSVRQGGALIGITRRRRRRAFATEVRRVRRTIQGCRQVLAAAEKPKRRSS